MMQEYKYTLEDLENMLPWERKIYVSMLEKFLKEKEKSLERQMSKRIEHPM
jgi:hypothetical protein